MTAELFAEWKRKKAEAREAEMTAKRAERARADRMRYDYLMSKLLSEAVVSAFAQRIGILASFWMLLLHDMCDLE